LRSLSLSLSLSQSLSFFASEAIHVRHILRTDALSGPTQFAPTSVIAQDTSLYPTGYCYCLVVPKAQSERDGDDTARDHMCAPAMLGALLSPAGAGSQRNLRAA
jgi:hypothetical protein